MRVFDFNAAIARTPGRSVVGGLRAGDGPDPDYSAILEEHRRYVTALRAAGVEVHVLDPLEAFADSMFVEDPALVFPEGAIVLRPGAPSRLGEADSLRPELGLRFAEVLILEDGFADGGDVLVTPDVVFIGLSDRTDRIGAEGLQRLLARLGRKARLVDTPPGGLHLKSAATLVDEETVLTTPELAAAGVFTGLRTLVGPKSEVSGACVLRVNDVVLAGAQFPRTLDLLADHGLTVEPLPVAEIVKIDAGLTCMSLRWWAN
jgi:dimethylargininase